MDESSELQYLSLEQASKLSSGTRVRTKVLLAKKTIALKANKEEYLLIGIVDKNGTQISMPVWNNVPSRKEQLVEGVVYAIEGLVNFYQDNFQIKDPMFAHLEDDPASFLPSFKIPPELIEYFDATIDSLEEPWRSLVQACMDKVTRDAFMKAPAAERHHHNRLGGLFLHTCGVLKAIDTAIQNYFDEPFWDFAIDIEPSRLRAKAIIHDMPKVWEYKYDVAICRKDYKMNHILDGIAMIKAINWDKHILDACQEDDICNSLYTHHGKWGPKEPETLEDNLLHWADMLDSRCINFAQTSIPGK